MARKIVPFSFRPGKDDDLEEAFNTIVEEEGTNKSDVIRKALKAYIFQLPTQRAAPQPERKLEAENLEDIELEEKEKTAEEIDGDLDNLLGDF